MESNRNFISEFLKFFEKFYKLEFYLWILPIFQNYFINALNKIQIVDRRVIYSGFIIYDGSKKITILKSM